MSSPQKGQPNQAWTYAEAFSRNRGLITDEEQQRLRVCRVAIAGMGGIGGIDLVTLARLGVGKFSIADPDIFETGNTNRQFGAMASTMGRPKAEVMAEIVRDINPEVDIRVFAEPIGPSNAEEFLAEADLFVDAIEVFEPDARRHLFQLARSNGIYGITAGPVGFSGIWISFDPHGMSFDTYFDIRDDMEFLEKLVAFAVGVAPKATQRSYMDLRNLNVAGRRGPSTSLACQIASGALACEAVKILLRRGKCRTAPCYHQFDPYVGRFVRGYVFRGNRNPWQLLKRRMLSKALKKSMQQ